MRKNNKKNPIKWRSSKIKGRASANDVNNNIVLILIMSEIPEFRSIAK